MITSAAAAGRPTGRGLTLLEMLLVLAILTAVVAITFPSVERMYRTHRLAQTAQQLRAQLAATRLRAIDEGIAYQFRFEPGGRHLLVGPQELAGPRFDDGDGPRRAPGGPSPPWQLHVELPEGLRFEAGNLSPQRLSPRDLAGMPQATALVQRGWSPPVVFWPSGNASGGEFALGDADGRYVELTVRGLTGATTATAVQRRGEP